MATDPTTTLVIDPQTAGIAGDMIVAALIDLDADATKVVTAMKSPEHCLPGCTSVKISVTHTTRAGIRARRVDVEVNEQVSQRTASDLLEALPACLARVSMSETAKRFALESLSAIVSAEATVHGERPADLHLHETGSADTLADILGAAAALDDLGLLAGTAIYSTPVAVGGGRFRTAHGTLASPAPATMEILSSRALLAVGGPVDGELATPTGVALLAALNPTPVRFYPPMKPTRVAYGAGSRDLADVPNVLRLTLGQPHDLGMIPQEVVVIETNLDDATGEVIGHAMQKLLEAGARDVAAIPTLAKKGRPGHVLQVIADQEAVEGLCRLLMDETGTLGVRIYPCQRRILARRSVALEVEIDGISAVVNVKVASTTAGQVAQVKPEYEDVKRLADATGRPLRDVERIVRDRAARTLQEQ